MRKKILCVILAFLLCSFSIISYVQAEEMEDLKIQQEELQNQITNATGELQGVQEKLSENLQQVQKLDEKIVKKPKDQKIMIGTKNSMLDFTVLLYILNFILLCINIWYLCNHSKRPYILREIKLYSCTIWYEIPLKMLGYICYFLFSLVMIDFVNILIYEIKKRFS